MQHVLPYTPAYSKALEDLQEEEIHSMQVGREQPRAAQCWGTGGRRDHPNYPGPVEFRLTTNYY